MKCIRCDRTLRGGAFCQEHDAPDRWRYVEWGLGADEEKADELLVKIRRLVWWDVSDDDVLSANDIEDILSENKNLANIRLVTRWMHASGHSNWASALNEHDRNAMKLDIKPGSSFTFTAEVPREYGIATRKLTSLSVGNEPGTYRQVFNRIDWDKFLAIAEEYYPETLIPEMKIPVVEPGDMRPAYDDQWTCHVAINRGQIVGGKWISTVKQEILRFDQFFTGSSRTKYRIDSVWGGWRMIAPATIENLMRLINQSDQPLETKWEASVEIGRIKGTQQVSMESFQWRLNTKQYADGSPHRYAYVEENNPLSLIPKRTKIGEQWDEYVNEYQLFSQQKICAEVAWAHRRIGLWLDMRLGKTLIALAVAKRAMRDGLIDRVLVVCPVTNLYDPWIPETAKQRFEMYCCDGTREEDVAAFGDDEIQVFMIGYEKLKNRLEYMQSEWDMERLCVIMDETSAIKNPQAKRTKACIDLCEHPNFVLALNCTPMEQGPADIWAQQFCLDRGRTFGVTFGEFERQYLRRDHTNKLRLLKNKQPVFEMMLAASSMRYIRSEGDQFKGKDKNFRYITIPPTEEMVLSTNRIIKGVQIENSGDMQAIKSCILVVYGHLREVAAGYDKFEEVEASGVYQRRRHQTDGKITWVRTFCKSNPGHPMVLYTEFSESEDRLMEMLDREGITYASLRPKYGSPYPPARRMEEINKFNSGEARVFICKNSQARGITLNRLDAVADGIGTYPSIVYMQPAWSLGSWKQSQDRCVGVDKATGRNIATMVYVLVIQGSIEEKIVKALRSKQAVAETLLKDAGRGGYTNPFEEMDMSGGDGEGDELFDAQDYEARYVLELPPQKPLTEQMIRKAGARLIAKRLGISIRVASQRPLPLEAVFLLSKLTNDGESDKIREALASDNVIQITKLAEAKEE